VVWHFGGSGNQISDQVGTWTPRSSAWSSQKFSSMKARYDHTAVWTGNDGYLFGGTVSGGSVYSDEILRFDRFGVEPQPTPTTTTPVPSTTNPAPTTPGPLTGSITPSTGLTTQGPTLEGTQEGEGPDGLPSQGPSDETSQPFGFSLTSVILIGVLAAGVAAPLGYVVFSSLRGKPAAIPVVAARTAPALGGPAMEVREVTVMRGGKPAIEGITFAAPAGQLTLLLGPSGSGKSTLLEAVVGLQPFRGQVLIAGEGAAEGTRKKSLGYVPQELQLYPNLNAEQNLVYFASQYGVASREARATARTLLERLGLADAANRPLSQLSGGQQRRVSIAAAMVHEPRLLVLDEPTSGLDYSARRSLWTLLQQISREHGLGVVATSHFMDDAQYADRIGVVDRGRLVSFGTLKQLLQELPGDGRCAVAEFDELQPADLAKLQNLLRSLQKEGLAERMDIKSFSARFYSKNPKGLSRVLPTLLERQGLAVRSTGLEELTVEDVFVYRTGRSPGAAP
jgi:ABC-2 type transport system ATP-binding protein